VIAAGNERVIRARLADGQFFYKADLAKPCGSYLPQLEKVTFKKIWVRCAILERLRKIAEQITEQLYKSLAQQRIELTPPNENDVMRAAVLCKADLVTQMVYEFPIAKCNGAEVRLGSGESERQ